LSGTIISEYFYDHEGNRIRKVVYNVSGDGNNESTYYLNTRPADFIQVVNTNGSIINETYIYLQDKLIAKIDTQGKKFFYHPDHLGSTSLVTNESGAVVEDLLYLPYGGILGGDEISRYTYTGQESDTESGFIDYGARQYDSRFSRFIQPDPITSDPYNPQNLNHYTYVLNNPYKYVDPNGKWAVQVGLGFSGGFTSLLFTKSLGVALTRSDAGDYQFGLYETTGKGALFGIASADVAGEAKKNHYLYAAI
jgi:RHS repeat-associated protein